MSRGLGPQQRRLLDYAGRYRGEPVGYVAEHLDVSGRRARKVIESCRTRGLVVVVNDPAIGRRVFTPDALWTWTNAQRTADAEREQATFHPPMHTGESGVTAR